MVCSRVQTNWGAKISSWLVSSTGVTSSLCEKHFHWLKVEIITGCLQAFHQRFGKILLFLYRMYWFCIMRPACYQLPECLNQVVSLQTTDTERDNWCWTENSCGCSRGRFWDGRNTCGWENTAQGFPATNNSCVRVIGSCLDPCAPYQQGLKRLKVSTYRIRVIIVTLTKHQVVLI